MRTRWMLLLGAALAVACGDKDEDDEGDETGAADDTGGGADDTGASGDCAARPPDACEDDARCASIDGRPLEDDGAGGACVDFSRPGQPLGCMSADGGCGDAETLAASAAEPDTCWWFPSTCLPAGWTGCAWRDYGECQP
jgi:hypothetical protein